MKRLIAVLLTLLCLFGTALGTGAASEQSADLSEYETDIISDYGLDTPALKSVSPESKGVLLKWGSVDGASMYRVLRKESGKDWQEIGKTAAVSYTDKTAVSGLTYAYTVQCISADDQSIQSAYDEIGKSISFIAAPVINSVSNVKGGVAVSWKKVTGAKKYRVYRKEGSASWKKVGDTAKLTLTDKKAVSNHTYSYTVRCISSDGKSTVSGYDTTGKKILYIAAPTVKSVANTYGGVMVTWNKVAGAVRYRIFRKLGSGGWKQLGNTTAISYLDKSAKSGYNYSYTVRCITWNGKSYTSGYDTVGKSVKYIAAPEVSSVRNSGLKLTIRWNKVAGAEMYRVFYRSPGGKWKTLGDTKSTSLTYTHANKTSTEYYTVRCMNKAKSKYTSGFKNTGYKFTLTVYGSSSGSTQSRSSTQTSTQTVSRTSSYYVGSVNSDVYHFPSCSSAKNIKASNLITFSSKEDARKHGYRPCEKCNP